MPPSMHQLRNEMVELLTHRPRRWLPLNLAYNLDQVLRFPGHFVRLHDMDVAIKLRTGASPKLQWQERR